MGVIVLVTDSTVNFGHLVMVMFLMPVSFRDTYRNIYRRNDSVWRANLLRGWHRRAY